ncbi:MAG: hypothetical protein AAGA68_18075 [Pseudomonadota bacterium]
MARKLMLMAALLPSLAALYGCAEGDLATITIDAPTENVTNNTDGGGDSGDAGDTGGQPGDVSTNCPAFSGAKPINADGNDVCALPAVISESQTLTPDVIWLMEGTVTVGNGNNEIDENGELTNGNPLLNVVLTIEPGTQIQGATGTFANMIITRGSRIEAVGTEADPIIFSSDDAGLDGSGEWGGLIMHGFGEHNQCDTVQMICNIDSEGESGFAGGFVADDNSGTLSYVIVAEGGFEFSPGNEINGISLVGVGSGTTMDHIQVQGNSDDGIEFYGGAVNLKYGVFTDNLDDSVDWDEGFVGNLQFIIVRQSENSFGNAFEMDTQGNPLPLSKPTLANVTVIGHGVEGDETEMLVFKAGSGGFFHNTVLTVDDANGTIDNCLLIEGADSEALINTALVVNNWVADCQGGAGVGVIGNDTLDATTISAVEAQLDMNLASQAPEALLAEPLDWVAINGIFSESLADVDFLEATDFIGAVNPDGSDVWWATWTLDGTL